MVKALDCDSFIAGSSPVIRPFAAFGDAPSFIHFCKKWKGGFVGHPIALL